MIQSSVRALHGTRRWLSLASRDVVSGSSVVAFEGDRWFLAAVRGVEQGATQAQRGIDLLAAAVAAQWIRRRPRWLRRRSSRERIERALRDEAKRHGFDVTQDQFAAFSAKMALLLELVYSGAVPLDAIAFEADPGSDQSSASES
jgi:hypothetical protein